MSRGARAKPRASVTARRRSSAGQGRSGLTWSAVTGDTPPQSSMPASSSTPKSSARLGGACAYVRREDQPASAMASGVVGGHGGALCMAAGLGEVLDDDLLHVFPAGVGLGDRPEGGSWSAGVSPMPTDATGRRDAEPPAASSVASWRSGFCRRPRWAARSAAATRDHPLTPEQQGSSSRGGRRHWRREERCGRASAHLGQVVDGRLVAVLNSHSAAAGSASGCRRA